MEAINKFEVESSELRDLIGVTNDQWFHLLSLMVPYMKLAPGENPKSNFELYRQSAAKHGPSTPRWQYIAFWSFPLIEGADYEYSRFYSGYMGGALAVYLRATLCVQSQSLSEGYFEVCVAPEREAGEKVQKRIYFDTSLPDRPWLNPRLAARVIRAVKPIREFELLVKAVDADMEAAARHVDG